MTTPTEAITKLCPILDAVITCQSRNRDLFPLQDAAYNIQLAIYWLKSVEEDMNKAFEQGIVTNQLPTIAVAKAPTMIATEEYFKFIASGLKSLYEELFTYSETVPLSQKMLSKVQQGNNRILEAYFTTELGNKYYQQMNGTNK